MRTYTREKDVVVQIDTEVFPATVDFQAILDSVRIEPDDCAGPPWETCDGLEHTRENDRVIVPWDESLERWYHARGASKQVAKQLTARSLAKRREYLENVYVDGYKVWVVICNFQGFHDSVWGVDDYTYASGELSEEIALNIASEMQTAGFDVTNLPDRLRLYTQDRQDRQDTYRRNIHLFDWS